jgi:hypothetical protein
MLLGWAAGISAVQPCFLGKQEAKLVKNLAIERKKLHLR